MFNAHLLPRALSTSPETLLTTLALVYFPLPPPEPPSQISVDKADLVASPNPKDVRKVGLAPEKRVASGEVLKLESINELDYVVMDRMAPLETADA